MSQFEGMLGKVRKMRTCVDISKEVCEVAQIERTVEELKKKWSDLNGTLGHRSRQLANTYPVPCVRRGHCMVGHHCNGGGPAPESKDIYFKVVEIIGEEAVDGISQWGCRHLSGRPQPAGSVPTAPARWAVARLRARSAAVKTTASRDRLQQGDMFGLQRQVLEAVNGIASAKE